MFFSNCTLLVLKNMFDLYLLTLYPVTLLKSHISCRFLLILWNFLHKPQLRTVLFVLVSWSFLFEFSSFGLFFIKKLHTRLFSIKTSLQQQLSAVKITMLSLHTYSMPGKQASFPVSLPKEETTKLLFCTF